MEEVERVHKSSHITQHVEHIVSKAYADRKELGKKEEVIAMYPSNPHSKRWVVHIFTKQAHSLSGRGEWRMLLLGQQNHACRKRYLYTDFNHFVS